MSVTTHGKIVHDKEPIRLFRSNLLEFFTHVHPVVVAAVWLPVAAYLFVSAVARQTSWVALAAGLPAGLFLWTLAEYGLHRFVFHFPPRRRWQERALYLLHGIHHLQPQVKTRLVMPPPVSIPLAVVFYGLFYLVLAVLLRAPHWLPPVFAGFILGYVLYDMTHYATHHLSMRRGYFKFLKRYHLQHHFKSPTARFGVTSPLWDRVFRTWPE